jgi:hypothetical protein
MISDQITGIKLEQGYVPAKGLKRYEGQCSAPSLLFGVELEIEGLTQSPDNYTFNGIDYHADGSLRNNGAEFVTRPMNYVDTEAVLHKFFNMGGFSEKNYSERCSVHVHINVGDISEEHLRTMLAVYASHERALFDWIGDNRKHNIFCVPWYETNLSTGVSQDMQTLANISRAWMKYTALNLLPIWRQNTIEFRHMGGTCNIERILTWMRLIAAMYTYSKNTPLKTFINTLNEVSFHSQYAPFTYTVFGKEADELVGLNSYLEVMEQSLLEAKAVLNKPKPIDKLVAKKLGAAPVLDAGVWPIDEALEAIARQNAQARANEREAQINAMQAFLRAERGRIRPQQQPVQPVGDADGLVNPERN